MLDIDESQPKRLKNEDDEYSSNIFYDDKEDMCQTKGCNVKIYLPKMIHNALENNYCNGCQNFYFKWMNNNKYLKLKCINEENVSCNDLQNCYHCKFKNLIASGFPLKCNL